MARDGGLSVSALRFFDRAGVLVPAWVDPVNGYRWYESGQLEEARLLARLRRAGMPLADIRLVLARWAGADTDLVRGLLQAHLRRLELGLSSAGEEPVHLAVDGDRVPLETGDRHTSGPGIGHEFPDYRRLVDLPAGRRAHVDTAAFRKALETGPVRVSETREQGGEPHDLSVLRVAENGSVIVCDDGDDDPDNVAVNREVLLDALTAGARDELVLEVGAPTAPLAVRRPYDEGALSLLMPVRLGN
ncbi:MerR family transcriptional regulator [Streptomyces parvulus]|uniref:MerR family transcriptional regulator n=1 Tax=Streptomyces parvulus TaxID=146923 RepID=UPI0037AF748E